MEKFDFVTVGNCTTNMILRFDDFPAIGKTSTATNPFGDEILYGGCVFNVFYALTKLGCRVKPVLRWSDPDARDRLYEILDEYDLPKDHIIAPKTRSYNRCILLQDRNQNHATIIYRFGEDSDHSSLYDTPIEVDEESFSDSKMMLMVMGNPQYSYRILQILDEMGLDFAFSYKNDPALLPKELCEAILPKAKIIFTNESEAKHLCSLLGLGKMTDYLYSGKAEVVVTTLGCKGSLVQSLDAEGRIRCELVPITHCEHHKVDSVGCGDAFVAGFMYGYSRGKSLGLCAQYGSTLSSFVLEGRGPTSNLPDLEQMLERNSRRSDARSE